MSSAVSATPPRISVVITCFNYAQYVGGAIESAVTQSYPHKEIVVVNDGSTDGSLGVINRYGNRITVVNQVNQGSVAAYNNGFAATAGDLVIFLDADDRLLPDALAEVASAWRPGHAKVQYDLGIIGAHGEDLGRRFCNFDCRYDEARARTSFQHTGTYRWPVTAGNAYARWFAAPLFPLHIDHGPDGTLNTVAPVYGEVITIPRVLGQYRIHGANMWTSDGLDQTRLPYRIEHRRREVAFMRSHAARRGVAVPDHDVLDHELPFLNYRLLALKLGLDYRGSAQDTVLGLLRAARRALVAEHLPPKLTVAHLAWFHLLAATPRKAVPALIRLRFGRAVWMTPARRAVARMRDQWAAESSKA
jgi:glycosyltransferase involved in cell wall biosynthesis